MCNNKQYFNNYKQIIKQRFFSYNENNFVCIKWKNNDFFNEKEKKNLTIFIIYLDEYRLYAWINTTTDITSYKNQNYIN